MPRVLLIVGALLLGLIGLGMSLCGGGVLVMMIPNGGGEYGSVIVIAILGLVLGIFCVMASVFVLRKKLDRQPDRDRAP